MDDGRAPRDLVLGANRLIIDIVEAVLDGCDGDRPVAVLVDPTSDHWDRVAGVDGTGVLVVLSQAGPADVVAAIHRGADAVLDAHEVTERLADAVHVVRSGGVVLTPTQAHAVAEALRRTDPGDGRPQLSKREAEILELICEGLSVKQTAIRLGIAAKTVENLQGRLFRKIEARNRAHAVARAFELGLLVDPPEVDAPSRTWG